MTATINASTSSGVIVTSDTSGSLAIQSNGTTIATAGSTGLQISSYNPGASLITSGTAQASTSGTSIDFTSIPSWVKRITVMFNGVSLSSTADFLVQLGTASGVETTGYTSTWAVQSSGGNSTSGFIMRAGSGTLAITGHMIITLLGSNLWISSATALTSTTQIGLSAGSKTTAATLDRIRITSTSTDTFDAGSINILYE